MSDNKYPVESFSVDDILREVREMRNASAKSPAKAEIQANAADNARIAEDKTRTNISAEKTTDDETKPSYTYNQHNTDIESARAKNAVHETHEHNYVKNATTPEPTKESDTAVIFSANKPQNDGKTRSIPNQMHDAQIPRIRPRANVITPDEINSGLNSQTVHISQKRKPKVITADELRQGHGTNAEREDNTFSSAQTVLPGEVDLQSEDDKLSELFAQKPAESDKMSAKDKIDALYGRQEETNDEYYEQSETKAERKARLKAEREEEKIRISEQKAAQKLQKKLEKSKAAAQDNDYSDYGEPSARNSDEHNKSTKANQDDFFTIENDINDNNGEDGKTKMFDAIGQSTAAEANKTAANTESDKTAEFTFLQDAPLNLDKSDKRKKAPAANDNADIADDTADAFDENADFEEPEDDLYTEPPKNRQKFRKINPVRVEPDKHEEDMDVQSDEIDDYNTIDDADAIRAGLDGKLSAIAKRAWLTFITAVLLGVLTLLPCFNISLPDAFSPEKNIKVYLTLNAVLFAIAIIVNIKTVINGIVSLIRLRPDIDTPVSIATLAVMVQLGFAFYISQPFASGTGCLYTAVCAAAMLFNLLGKRCMFSRIRANFELIATTGIKQSCFAMKNKTSAVISDYLAPKNTTVACQRPVINLHNFLYNSFSEDPSDRVNAVVAPLSLAAALLSLVIAYMKTGDLSQSIGTLALISSICVPLTTAFAANRPLRKSAKRTAELGGLISGYSSVESFADTEYAVVNDYDLFSSGSIELLNLKAVGDNSIDDVIMDAAALVIAANSPLKDVFERMIVGRTNFLKQTDNIIYTDGKGISGTIGGDTMCVGNRSILDGCSDINLPDIEFERKIGRKGCFAVYIARNNELCGMLVIRYTVNDEMLCEQIQKLTDNGVTLLVKTVDPNITERLICGAFSLGENTVHILPADCADEYDEQTKPRESGDSLIAHRNSLAGYACAINSAKRLKLSVMLGVILQTVGIVLGFAAALYFALIGGYNSVLPSTVLIYQLICAVIVIAIPSFRKA